MGENIICKVCDMIDNSDYTAVVPNVEVRTPRKGHEMMLRHPEMIIGVEVRKSKLCYSDYFTTRFCNFCFALVKYCVVLCRPQNTIQMKLTNKGKSCFVKVL